MMDHTCAFELDLPGYEFRTMQATDMPALQRLFEKCADYVWIVDGQEVPPTAAEETFYAGPPGRPTEDKFLLGLFDPQNELVAVLEGFQHYPEAGIWWIGLLMLAPEARGHGYGRRLIDGFVKHVVKQGGTAIMLGVVEENQNAYAFWEKVGFQPVTKTEPRPFGKKRQVVQVMRRAMVEFDATRSD